MFIDEKPSLKTTAPIPTSPEADQLSGGPIDRKTTIIAVSGAIIVMLGVGAWWWFFQRPNSQQEQAQPVVETEVTPGLPVTLDPNTQEGEGAVQEGDPNIKGENIRFGEFYESLDEEFEIKAAAVTLPLNIKSDVSNYYDVSRKINLDPVIANLNRDGFAVIDNPFPDSPDFFGIYRDLNQRNIPSLVTADFLLYYYQNSLKQIYKEIESSFFYESLWKINKQLYDTANARYQDRKQKVGLANDPLLEAQRLEAAYFATSLALLRPSPDQINATEELSDSRKFKPSEARRFEFSVPSYLTEDFERELTLIREARTTAKSPLLLYERDYRDFTVPSEYADNSKLKNFYLASRWSTSLFPLTYKDGDCPKCLLDREDWVINQTAAHLIAFDMSANQSLKNEWAKVYKVISFFTGLRSELTYLHYDQVRAAAFPGKSLDEVFGTEAFERLTQMRAKLLEIKFSAAEGALSRTADKPQVGMRLLQTFYWPSQYISKQLTYGAVGNHNVPRVGGDFGKYLTACEDRDKLVRCKALGYDTIALVADEKPKSNFLVTNMNYQRYNAQVDSLKKEISTFNQNNWHNNNFWTTLSTAESLIDEKLPTLPYTGNDRWLERKLSTALAAMTNLTLGADEWQIARSQGGAGLETSGALATLGYVEPNSRLADELVANATMLFKTLSSLGVVRDNDARFADLVGKLTSGRSLIRKELTGESLATEDYQFLSDLSGQYKVSKAADKSTTLSFFDSSINHPLSIRQTIAPARLMLLVYEKDGKKVLAAGPIFSYKEE